MQGSPDLQRTSGESDAQNALGKILSSRTFQAAHGQKSFLRYVVEQTLAGNAHLLKEYVIGTEALGRIDSFDPRLDPIVRTQARKLRARLEKYYQTEGELDSLRIEFPKGSYVPLFHERKAIETSDELFVADAPLTPRNEFPWKLTAIALAASTLILAAVGFYYVGFLPGASPVLTGGASIAVLPFVSLGGKDTDKFLSDGLTDELIDSLRTVKGLQVVAHTSAFRLKPDANVKEVFQKLHVRTELVGSINRTENRLRISVQLNSLPNGYHLWSGSYDREANDFREVEVEISRSVANVLGMALTRAPGGEKEMAAMLSGRPLPNPSAHESYLKGLYFWNKLTVEGLRAATNYFREAIAEDPSYARAYAALADCYVMEPQLSTTAPLEAARRIKEVADKALALDESLGEAHIDLAISAEYEFDWNLAEAEFQKGLSLNPGNAIGHLWYAKYLAMVGRKSEVLTQRRLAADLDPVSAYAAQSVAGYFSVMGRYDAAISQFRSALALEPNFGLTHQGLGFTYLLAGRRSEGLEELKVAQKVIGGPRRLALVAYAYAVSGEPEYAQRILDGFLEEARHAPFPALAIADVYIGLGDNDRAFEWLDKAVEQRDLNLDLKWDPLFATVRPDPRYNALLRRMKLT